MKKIFMFLILGLFMISFASAWDGDNVYDYDEETKTATVENWLGLGPDLAYITLTSPQNVRVVRGNDRLVGEFNFTTTGDFMDTFGDIYLEDVRSGNEISRGKQFKYKKYKNVSVDDYETTCEDVVIGNGTIKECTQVEVGSHWEIQMDWIPIINPTNIFYEDVTYEIGVFVDVEEGDYGDWIPSIMGVEIEEWATWTEALSVNLTSYYKLDDDLATTKVIDSLGINNGTASDNTQDMSVAGLINKSFDFDGTTYVNTNIAPNINPSTKAYTISTWANSDFTAQGQIVWGTSIGTNQRFYLSAGGVTGDWSIYLASNSVKLISTTPVDIGNWVNVVVTFDGAGGSELFINGVSEDTYAADSYTTTGNLFLGSISASGNFDGLIDEVGIWDRELTQSEITQLYNGGNGITYSEEGISVSLNEPENNTVQNDATVDFNWTITPVGLNISNWTLNVWNSSNTLVHQHINTTINTNETTTVIHNDTFLLDESYIWNVESCGDTGVCDLSANWTFTLDTAPPVVNITYPPEGFVVNTPLENITLNYTVEHPVGNLSNCFYNTTSNSTPTSINCTTNTTSLLYPVSNPDNLTIYVFANDTGSNLGSDNVTIYKDNVTPQINVTAPVGVIDFGIAGTNETLNVTFTDTNLDSCWYNYNGTNITINGCLSGIENSTEFMLEDSNTNMTVYANDSLGNENSSFVSWSYTIFELNQTYDNITFETFFNDFEIYIESSASSITNPKLIYENITYTANLNVVSSTLFYLNSSIISNETLVGNNSFYWNITLDGTEYSTEEKNQTILEINFSECDGSNNVTYLSIDFKDELTLESINATIRASTFNYFVDDAEAYKTYTFSTAANQSQYDFCFSPSEGTIINDFSISYYGDGYPERTYGSVFEFTNETTNLTLNLLDDSSGIYATFKFIDSTTKIGLSLVNVLIYDGVDLVVEKITDDGGLVSEWLNPNILYEVQYTKTGYTGGSQSHRPISAETIPIEMSSDSLIPDPSITNGLTQYYYPQLTDLDEDTNYTFGYYVSEGEEEISLMKFIIYDEDGNAIDGAEITGDGNISLSQPINTSQNKTLTGIYEINGTDGGYYKFIRTYYVTVVISEQYSLDQWGLSLDTYFPADERTTLTNLVWYIIWFISMLGGFTFGYNGSFKTREDYTDNVTSGTRGNTTTGLFFAFIITLIFTYFNMIPMPVGVINPGFLIPDAWMEQNFMGLIILVVLVWDILSGITKHSRRGN